MEDLICEKIMLNFICKPREGMAYSHLLHAPRFNSAFMCNDKVVHHVHLEIMKLNGYIWKFYKVHAF